MTSATCSCHIKQENTSILWLKTCRCYQSNIQLLVLSYQSNIQLLVIINEFILELSQMVQVINKHVVHGKIM